MSALALSTRRDIVLTALQFPSVTYATQQSHQRGMELKIAGASIVAVRDIVSNLASEFDLSVDLESVVGDVLTVILSDATIVPEHAK